MYENMNHKKNKFVIFMNILGNKYKIHFVSKMPKDILVEENKAIGVTQFDEKRIYIVYQDSTFLTNKIFWHEIGHLFENIKKEATKHY